MCQVVSVTNEVMGKGEANLGLYREILSFCIASVSYISGSTDYFEIHFLLFSLIYIISFQEMKCTSMNHTKLTRRVLALVSLVVDNQCNSPTDCQT